METQRDNTIIAIANQKGGTAKTTTAAAFGVLMAKAGVQTHLVDMDPQASLTSAFGRVDPQYKSYFIANPASGLEPSAEFPLSMRGKSFTFGSASSTSGRMMPEYFLREATGESPQEFFGAELHFSGNHDATWQLVQEGTFDAGVLSYKTYESKVASGQIDPQRCFVIWSTPPYADYSWNAHPRLEEEFGAGFIDRVQRALVEMTDPELLAALMREEGLVEATNEDFEALGELARELDLVR